MTPKIVLGLMPVAVAAQTASLPIVAAAAHKPAHVKTSHAPDIAFEEGKDNRGRRSDRRYRRVSQNVHVVRTDDESWNKSAVDAVRNYGFKAAVKEGRPARVEIHVEVNSEIK